MNHRRGSGPTGGRTAPVGPTLGSAGPPNATGSTVSPTAISTDPFEGTAEYPAARTTNAYGPGTRATLTVAVEEVTVVRGDPASDPGVTVTDQGVPLASPVSTIVSVPSRTNVVVTVTPSPDTATVPLRPAAYPGTELIP